MSTQAPSTEKKGNPAINRELLDQFYKEMDALYQGRIDSAVKLIVQAKKDKQKICVITGSGPNLHEGITTFIAELIKKDIIDGGVLTSSAVVSHEMAGALDKVKRVDAIKLNFGSRNLSFARDNKFELTQMSKEKMQEIETELKLDQKLIEQIQNAEGNIIIKAAGNMAYPMGLRTEGLARDISKFNRERLNGKYSLEYLAGLAADPRTMIGAGAAKGVPVMVSIPQLVGGGEVGLAIGDCISIHERARRNAQILGQSAIIIESGLALAQEVHDGPFETYTGHGIWTQWQGEPVFSLGKKTLIRFDLDSNLEKVWQQERNSGLVQQAIAQGKPKTKLTGVPFRMEMSGFARLEGSIPVIGDIGRIWPVIFVRVADELGIQLDFVSYPQETPDGQQMREWIVNNVDFIHRKKLEQELGKIVSKGQKA